MNFSAVAGDPSKVSADVLTVWQDESGEFGEVLSALDTLSDGFFTKLKESGDLPAKENGPAVFVSVPNLSAKRVVVCSLKDEAKGLREMGATLFQLFSSRGWQKCALGFSDIQTKHAARILFCAMGDAAYRFNQFKSLDDKEKEKVELAEKIQYDWMLKEVDASVQEDVAWARAWVMGSYLTRDLGNMPANICTPTWLGQQAEKLAQEYDTIETTVFDEQKITEFKMRALLCVAQGSVQEPRLIQMEYQPENAVNKKPIVLVGKGVTFDAGGISLKPAADMDLMKYDMCGAATVFGVLKAVAEAKLPVHVIGIVPSVENLPSGSAVKPGDIVTSMSGKTIEVLNTDAEGRLILCDALTYAAQFKPQAVIDMATLTGAVVIALGSVRCGLFANNAALQDALFRAGEAIYDRAWKMPLDEDYKEMMRSSPFADLANISGSREAGSVTAAAFLSEFTQDYPWAHLDIAGVADRGHGKRKGATGRPVALLLEYLTQLAS